MANNRGVFGSGSVVAIPPLDTIPIPKPSILKCTEAIYDLQAINPPCKVRTLSNVTNPCVHRDTIPLVRLDKFNAIILSVLNRNDNASGYF